MKKKRIIRCLLMIAIMITMVSQPTLDAKAANYPIVATGTYEGFDYSTEAIPMDVMGNDGKIIKGGSVLYRTTFTNMTLADYVKITGNIPDNVSDIITPGYRDGYTRTLKDWQEDFNYCYYISNSAMRMKIQGFTGFKLISAPLTFYCAGSPSLNKEDLSYSMDTTQSPAIVEAYRDGIRVLLIWDGNEYNRIYHSGEPSGFLMGSGGYETEATNGIAFDKNGNQYEFRPYIFSDWNDKVLVNIK